MERDFSGCLLVVAGVLCWFQLLNWVFWLGRGAPGLWRQRGFQDGVLALDRSLQPTSVSLGPEEKCQAQWGRVIPFLATFLVGLSIHLSPWCQSLLMWYEGCGFYPQGTRFQGCPLLWCWGWGQKMPSYSWSSWCWARLLVLGPQTSCPLSYDLPEFPFGCKCASCRASSPSELNMQGKQVYTVPSSPKF